MLEEEFTKWYNFIYHTEIRGGCKMLSDIEIAQKSEYALKSLMWC